eukprot:scaffold654138_cov59-Prasinocladus_malaysianus.AAC.1
MTPAIHWHNDATKKCTYKDPLLCLKNLQQVKEFQAMPTRCARAFGKPNTPGKLAGNDGYYENCRQQ